MLHEVPLALELVLQGLREVPHILHGGGSGAILVHRMAQLMALGQPAGEETVLAHVEIETLQTAVP